MTLMLLYVNGALTHIDTGVGLINLIELFFNNAEEHEPNVILPNLCTYMIMQYTVIHLIYI